MHQRKSEENGRSGDAFGFKRNRQREERDAEDMTFYKHVDKDRGGIQTNLFAFNLSGAFIKIDLQLRRNLIQTSTTSY